MPGGLAWDQSYAGRYGAAGGSASTKPGTLTTNSRWTAIRSLAGTLAMRRSIFQILFLGLVTSAIGQTPGGVGTNLQLWLRAEGYTGGGTWADASGNLRDA